MREVEFIPAWYPALRRRRRAVMAQAWLTLAIVLAMTGATIAKRLDIRRQQTVVRGLERQINLSNQQLASLEQLLKVRGDLQNRQRAIDQMGVNVDTTRLMNMLEEMAPSPITLTGLSFETIDMPSGGKKLNVRLQGLAPGDTETASLLARLGSVKFISDVTMTSIRERRIEGHPMREFEAGFSIMLAAPTPIPVSHSRPTP